MGCAYWIFRDGEFRPIDTAIYCISSILLWPIVAPAWMVLRPPSQIKDLTWEKSYAHYKHWQKTHKVKDIGKLTTLDKKIIKGNGEKTQEQEETAEFLRATSVDHPYVIGSAGRTNSEESLPEKITEDEYGWDEIDDRAPTYEIGSSKPREAFNPFKKEKKASAKMRYQRDIHEQIANESEHPKTEKKVTPSRGSESFNVPSISDILEEQPSQAPREGVKIFRDANVRKLIDDGRLRDAYRVCRRMMKVAQELGEEDRMVAYRRYLREIENRMKATQEHPES